MITAERLKPFLQHDDPSLRWAAVKYFHDCWATDGDLIPLILLAWQSRGTEEDRHALAIADRFRLTDAGLAEVLALLPQVADENAQGHLNSILLHAPIDVVTRAEPVLRATAHVRPETLSRLQRRRALAARSGDDLWRELQAVAERSRDDDHVDHMDHNHADDLIDALASHAEPDADTLCRLLESNREKGDWLASFLVDLAGSRRLGQAVPVLVSYLEDDTDYLRERINEALGRIGDPEASRLVRARFGAWPWHARLYATTVLGAVKQPASEEAVLELLEQEKDVSIRTWLCFDLCKLFSEQGVERVRREIEAGYDRMAVNLEEQLLPVADVLGVPLPEAEPWRLERAERQRRKQERLAELAELGRRAQAAQKARSIPSPERARGELTALSKLRPAQRTGERVGRNDPCPCGSGKKFKKCCGAR